MNAYSKEIRLRILRAVDLGMSRKEVAKIYGVSLPTIERYIRQRREGGDLAPKLSPGRTPTIGATVEERRVLWRQLEDNKDATLERHCELWDQSHGLRFSVATMSRAFRRLGWTYKKGVWVPPSVMKRQEVLNESE